MGQEKADSSPTCQKARKESSRLKLDKTGDDKRNVSKLINILIQRGHIKRIGRGEYHVFNHIEAKIKEKQTKEEYRKVITERYNKVCYFCDYDEVVAKHHIIPREKSGSDHPSNLIGVCPNCHGKIHLLNYHLVYKKGFYYMRGGKKNMNPTYYQRAMPRPPSIDLPEQSYKYDETE